MQILNLLYLPVGTSEEGRWRENMNFKHISSAIFFFETKGEEMSLPKNRKEKISADFPHLSPMNVKRRVGRRAPIVGFPFWGCLEPC